MIKFFRHIRQTLIMENKTSKYLKYAIGEIVLVVIGILIALQINNWNQLKKDGNTEKKYLFNIISDLEEQLSSIRTQKKYEKNFMDTAIPLITYYNTHLEFPLDSTFFAKISSLNTRKTFITTDPTFTDLVSSGNIRLFKNDELKKKIISYYQEIELSEKIMQNNNTLIVDQQFGNIIKDIAYYYVTQTNRYIDYVDSLDKEVKKASNQLSYYNSNLAQTSKNILALAENQLILMNALNQRANVGIAHYQRVLILENKTIDLIKEIETVLND